MPPKNVTKKPVKRPVKRLVKKPVNNDSASRRMVKRQIVIGVILAVIISLLTTIVYYVSRIDSLQVKEIEVVGGKTISHEEVNSLVAEAFSGEYFKLVPKSFKWTFSEKAVVERVKTIDRVNNVKVELEGNKVLVVFDEYLPVALWCAGVDSTSCLFMDRSGYAFAEAPELSGSAFVRYVEVNQEPQKHQAAFAGDYIKNNDKFVDRMKTELGLYVTHIEKVGDYDMEFTVSGGGKIKASQDYELDKTFNNLKTILQSKDFTHIASGEFNYIDLRFGDKVFVSEEIPAEESLVATSTASTT